jgi:pentatricopeptide repeat protein
MLSAQSRTAVPRLLDTAAAVVLVRQLPPSPPFCASPAFPDHDRPRDTPPATLVARDSDTSLDAHDLFDGTPRRNSFSWNATVAGHASRGSIRDSLGAAARMHSAGAGLTEATFASVLGACARGRRFREGAQAHCQALKSGHEGFALVGASLLDFYSSCFDLRTCRTLFEFLHPRNDLLWSPMVVALVRFGLLSEAVGLLELMPSPRDVFSWTAVISGYAKGSEECCGKALHLFVRLMSEDSVMPNEYTYDSVLRACVGLKQLDFGRTVHGCLIGSGYETEQLITSALIDLYCSSDALDDALLVYKDLEMPSLITSNTLIARLASMGKTNDAKMVFSQMPKHDSGSYNLMIKACATEGRIEECLRIFEKMPRRNMVSLNSMMSVLLQNRRLDEGLKLFEQIKD